MMLSAFRKRIAGGLASAIDGVGFVASLAGASASLFLGKLFASALFVLLALGVLNRFVRRRHGETKEEQQSPVWISLVCAVLATVETAVVVEALNLPVRFDQPGFEKSNWLLVAAVLLFLFYAQRYVLRRLLAKGSTASAL